VINLLFIERTYKKNDNFGSITEHLEMDLIINSTFETPAVRFIESNGDFQIKGRIIPNSGNAFWKNIHTWVTDTIPKVNVPVTLTIEIEYINAYSVTQLLNLISSLKSVTDRGCLFSINWISDKDDGNEVYLIGQDIAAATNCPFEFSGVLENCN